MLGKMSGRPIKTAGFWMDKYPYSFFANLLEVTIGAWLPLSLCFWTVVLCSGRSSPFSPQDKKVELVPLYCMYLFGSHFPFDATSANCLVTVGHSWLSLVTFGHILLLLHVPAIVETGKKTGQSGLKVEKSGQKWKKVDKNWGESVMMAIEGKKKHKAGKTLSIISICCNQCTNGKIGPGRLWSDVGAWTHLRGKHRHHENSKSRRSSFQTPILYTTSWHGLLWGDAGCPQDRQTGFEATLEARAPQKPTSQQLAVVATPPPQFSENQPVHQGGRLRLVKIAIKLQIRYCPRVRAWILWSAHLCVPPKQILNKTRNFSEPGTSPNTTELESTFGAGAQAQVELSYRWRTSGAGWLWKTLREGGGTIGRHCGKGRPF